MTHLTIPEAAALLNKSEPEVTRMVENGVLRVFPGARRGEWFIDRAQALSMLPVTFHPEPLDDAALGPMPEPVATGPWDDSWLTADERRAARS